MDGGIGVGALANEFLDGGDGINEFLDFGAGIRSSSSDQSIIKT